jgi:hypothetical protein
MDTIPEIEKILNFRNLRSTNTTLILNGNTTTPIRMDKKRFIVNNTCPFDSVAVVIAMAYLDNPLYKEFIDNNNNQFLEFCKKLVTTNTSAIIQKERLKILKSIFKENTGITGVTVIDSTCNVLFIVTSLLKDAPSANENIICTHKNCENGNRKVSCPTIILRLKDGFKNLENSLQQYISTKLYTCVVCEGTTSSSKTLNEHLFIETDVLADKTKFKLTDIPLELQVNSKT